MVKIPGINDEQRDNIDVDDDIVLPADTLAILNQFLREKAETESTENSQSFEENWQLSQFWYNEATKSTLAKVCLKLILNRAGQMPTSDVQVALLSCPSLYKSVKSIHPNGTVKLFEFDKRFATFSDDFVYYDYNRVAAEPGYLQQYAGQFDIILVDPPFLAEECIQAVSVIVNRLRKNDTSIVLCSGDIVSDWAKTFMNLNKCTFRPQHERNLANEFGSYANFDLDAMI